MQPRRTGEKSGTKGGSLRPRAEVVGGPAAKRLARSPDGYTLPQASLQNDQGPQGQTGQPLCSSWEPSNPPACWPAPYIRLEVGQPIPAHGKPPGVTRRGDHLRPVGCIDLLGQIDRLKRDAASLTLGPKASNFLTTRPARRSPRSARPNVTSRRQSSRFAASPVGSMLGGPQDRLG